MPDPKIPLDCKVLRGGTVKDDFQVTLDPEDHEALQGELERWLADNKWHKGLWGGFRLEVRRTGEGKVIKTVRVRA